MSTGRRTFVVDVETPFGPYTVEGREVEADSYQEAARIAGEALADGEFIRGVNEAEGAR